jgi:hypothetical protein
MQRVLPLVGILAVLVGCGGREVSRIQTSGLYEESDFRVVEPPDRDEIYRIPVGNRTIHAEAPVVDGYLLVVLNRREVYRRTGAILPPDVDRKSGHPSRQWRELAAELEDISHSVQHLLVVMETPGVSGVTIPEVAPLQEALEAVCVAIQGELQATSVSIPQLSSSEARWQESFATAGRLFDELSLVARIFIGSGILVKEPASGPWAVGLEGALADFRTAYGARDAAQLSSATHRIRSHIASMDDQRWWDDAMTGPQAGVPSEDIGLSQRGYRRLRMRSAALWAEVLSAILRLTPDQPTPVLVYQDGAR